MRVTIASRPFAVASSAAVAVLIAATLVGVLAIVKPGLALRGALLAGVCLALWLSELVPVWVPTLVLWGGAPLVLYDAGPRFSPIVVVGWSVDPVLVLFLSGFALAAAARRCGADELVAQQAMRLAGGSAKRFVAITVMAAALLSMWMSNVAAAALLIGALAPVWGRHEDGAPLRRAILLAIALGANVGGIATPIGTGPNGIAMAAVSQAVSIDFLRWMAFGVPLALGLAAAAIVYVLVRFRPRGSIALSMEPPHGSVRDRWVLATVFALAVMLWLTESLHGVRSWEVALGVILALVAPGLLRLREARQIQWGTLTLIAGGIGLGTLLEQTGAVALLASTLQLEGVPQPMRLLGLCFASAILSSLMSNTATAGLLIPLAATMDAAPSTAILVAVASSLGMLFVISTPPNAMAVAHGLRAKDLFLPGLILMIGGCILVALTGPAVLRTVGIP